MTSAAAIASTPSVWMPLPSPFQDRLDNPAQSLSIRWNVTCWDVPSVTLQGQRGRVYDGSDRDLAGAVAEQVLEGQEALVA